MDRRTFLKTTVGTVGAASVAGCSGRTDREAITSTASRYLGIQQVGQFNEETVATAEGTVEAPQAQATNVMEEKVNQAVNNLTKTGQGTQVYEAAITEGMEALFMSNGIVLPTDGVPETIDIWDKWYRGQQNDPLVPMMIGGLDQHINNDIGTEESKATAMGGRNFLQVTGEAADEIHKETFKTDPADPQSNPKLSQPDTPQPAGSSSTQVIDVNQVEGFHREVRSPFFMGINLAGINSSATPGEAISETDSLWPGECQAVLKETRGVKAIVRPVKVPIWVEPWSARASIVGTTLIWFWEFVPAQFIKTVEVCNDNNSITTTVDTQVHVDRGLMHFWRFLN